jgi:uncharacterized protein
MFRVNLGELDRKGTITVHHRFALDDPGWEDSGLEFETPLEVDLDVLTTGTGQVVARGEMRAVLREACRRCLVPVELEVREPLSMVWEPSDGFPGGTPGEEDDDVRTLASDARELELGQVVREEFLLAAPRYVTCTTDCRGLCPRCGVNRNEGECNCSTEELDPRWGPLRGVHR